ncbi:hypothetical protein D046_3522A, partial [Vibrio parahaemolyticus V-223/04]
MQALIKCLYQLCGLAWWGLNFHQHCALAAR